jgi:hypothetical protein
MPILNNLPTGTEAESRQEREVRHHGEHETWMTWPSSIAGFSDAEVLFDQDRCGKIFRTLCRSFSEETMFTPWYIAIVTLPLVKLLGSILHMELLIEPRPAQRVVITYTDSMTGCGVFLCQMWCRFSTVQSVQYPQHGFWPLETKDDQHLFSYMYIHIFRKSYRKSFGWPSNNTTPYLFFVAR